MLNRQKTGGILKGGPNVIAERENG
jgi:hypothetical protein